jgi:hypothetical protein
MSRGDTPGLDPVLEFAQIKLADIGPDQPRRMVFPNQALDIHRSQRDLVALRFTQPRRSKRCRVSRRLRLIRQFPKQVIGGHQRLPRIHHRQRITLRRRSAIYSAKKITSSQAGTLTGRPCSDCWKMCGPARST